MLSDQHKMIVEPDQMLVCHRIAITSLKSAVLCAWGQQLKQQPCMVLVGQASVLRHTLITVLANLLSLFQRFPEAGNR